MFEPKTFGPELPPSTWPLDDVPGPIIDGIVKQFAKYDKAYYRRKLRSTTTKKEQPYYGHFPDRPIIKVLGPHTSSLSLVSKSFRQASTRGIFNCIEFKSSRSVHLLGKQLGPGARSQVTHLTIRKDDKDRKIFDKTVKETARFISTLPKLEQINDSSAAFLHKSMPLPESMKFIGIILRSGEAIPESLGVRSVFCLGISAGGDDLLECEHNMEATFWHSKVSALLRGIKQVKMLTFRMPGLPTCGCSHQGSPIPENHRFRSPLENVSFTTSLLHLYLPFCSAIPGHQREYQWWAYLGWLIDSKAKFQQLHLTMGWTMSLLRGPSASGLTVQESLGIGFIETEDALDQAGRPSGMKVIKNPVDEATKSFFLQLFAHHPELKRVQLKIAGELGFEPSIGLRFITVEASNEGPRFSQEFDPRLTMFVERVLDTISAGYMPAIPHQWTTQDLRNHIEAHPYDLQDLFHSAATLHTGSHALPFPIPLSGGMY